MPFRPGQSGNPAGRPRRQVEDVKQSVLNQVFDAAAERQVLLNLISIACNPEARNAVAAAKLLLERKYGPVLTPEQPEENEIIVRVEYSGDDG